MRPKKEVKNHKVAHRKVDLTCPTNSSTKALKAASKQAAIEGILPHEWLAKVASGQMIIQRRLVIEYHKTGLKKGLEKDRTWVEEEYYPSFSERQDAAKAAAPFFAPRLAIQQTQVTPGTGNKTLIETMKELAEKLPT